VSGGAPARQLPMPLPHRPSYGPDFLPAASNAAARLWLDRMDEWPQRRLALWGEAGSGKTHLLHRWAGQHGAELIGGVAPPDRAVLPARPIALDDANRCSDEPALLHLLNSRTEAGVAVLLAAREPPARWPVRLPDLASRLRAIQAVRIEPLEDELLRALLARLLAERQLRVPSALQDWLLRRLPRSAAVLREAAARLDAAALAARGPVTRVIAATALADLLDGSETT
jgi:chromosomal replication initiation ATPase DnaA